MQTNLYLNSLLADLATHGIGKSPELSELEVTILQKAAELAGNGSNKTSATGQVDSIFSHLVFSQIQGEEKQGLKKSFPKIPLDLTDKFFPGQVGEVDLKTQFEEEIKSLDALGNELSRAETLLFLLHKYGATMPSGIAPEISLYDFAKSKAAFAQCLAVFPDLKNLPSETFLLVGGDMSGIQEFLYDIVSTNASKNLKGRSFYLHLLGDTILTCLLKKLELPQANVVYSSGGSFYVLTPNTSNVQSKLLDFEKEVNQNFFDTHKTSLSFIIGQTEFSEDVILQKQIGTVWKDLNKKFEQKKRAKFNQQFHSNFNELFEPSEVGGEMRRDVVTGAEILDDEMDSTYKLEDSFPEKVTKKDWDERNVDFIRAETAEQIFMGLFLKSTIFRMNGDEDLKIKLDGTGWEHDQKRKFTPAKFGINQFILDDQTVNLPVLKSEPRQTLAINEPDFGKKINGKGIKGFELYGGNDYPKIWLFNKRGNPYEAAKTFSELAGMEDDDRQDKYIDEFKEAKFKRLGILRMDVDNLGKIFEEAFQKTGTLAHYSALSRQLDWFFKGYLNTLWDKGVTNKQLWRDHTQIIYSGGDDLFIVGKWDCLIDFAETIREEFKKWTCEHAGIGISGGIVLVTPKFPVIKAAEMCGKAEKNAKKHKTRNTNKNAICLFDYPLSWENEWGIVKNLKDQFVKMVGEKLIPKSLLMMLAAYHELKKEQKERGESPTWRWQIAYNLTRQKQRVRTNEAYAFIEKLATEILIGTELSEPRVTQYEHFDLVAVAVRWAEYDLQTEHNSTEKN
jgi:CRISPR-associated protein Csm1